MAKVQTQISFAETLIESNKKSLGIPNLHAEFIKNPKHLTGLVELAISNKPHPFPEYASWLLMHVARKQVDLIQPFYPEIIKELLITKNETVKRNLLGVVKCLPVQEYLEGEFLDTLISWISANDAKPAIVMYGLEMLMKFTKKYPELKPEILAIINRRTEEEITPAMRVWIKRFNKGK